MAATMFQKMLGCCVVVVGALVAVSVTADSTTTRWAADFETGNTSQWYAPSNQSGDQSGGGEFNSGLAYSRLSQAYAHSGQWSLEMTISPPPKSAVRFFRWLEPQQYPKLYYSVWYYFPRHYAVSQFWNIFQWKSTNASTGSIDPFFVLNVGNRTDGTMNLYLYDVQAGSSYLQPLKSVPVERWFRVDALYECSGDATGRVVFWQDGSMLFDVRNVRTRYASGDCQWSVDNYSDGLSPSPATIYVDDAEISLSPPESLIDRP